jgi:hypothetical protein
MEIARISLKEGQNSFAAEKNAAQKYRKEELGNFWHSLGTRILVLRLLCGRLGRRGATPNRSHAEHKAILTTCSSEARLRSLAALEIWNPFPHDPQRCTNLRH